MHATFDLRQAALSHAACAGKLSRNRQGGFSPYLACMQLGDLESTNRHGAATSLTLARLLAQTGAPMRAGGFGHFCRALPALLRRNLAGNFDAAAFQRRTRRAAAPLQSTTDMLCYNAFLDYV